MDQILETRKLKNRYQRPEIIDEQRLLIKDCKRLETNFKTGPTTLIQKYFYYSLVPKVQLETEESYLEPEPVTR